MWCGLALRLLAPRNTQSRGSYFNIAYHLIQTSHLEIQEMNEHEAKRDSNARDYTIPIQSLAGKTIKASVTSFRWISYLKLPLCAVWCLG